MFLKRLYAENFLSFDEQGPDFKLGPLNVLIGPNGSGKSNFIDIIYLLKSLCRDPIAAIQKCGGVNALIAKKFAAQRMFSICAEFSGEHLFSADIDKDYIFKATFFGHSSPEIVKECLYEKNRDDDSVYLLFERDRRSISTYDDGNKKVFNAEKFGTDESVLKSHRYRNDILLDFADELDKIKIYRDRGTGRSIAARWPQPADAKSDFLDEEGANLALVLNDIRRFPKQKRDLIEKMARIYDGITDFSISVQANFVQLFVEEGDISIPATRVSDGTLHFFSYLAILCHPKPPSLICIEEPEVGLHPDMMNTIAELLLSASNRTQLIVTTHSNALIDALSNHPECVIVCEKSDGITHMDRLEASKLEVWLEEYSLGQLWTRGDIGGTRW